jgi:hypothetical protein
MPQEVNISNSKYIFMRYSNDRLHVRYKIRERKGKRNTTNEISSGATRKAVAFATLTLEIRRISHVRLAKSTYLESCQLVQSTSRAAGYHTL